jgi:hypothetical protein
VDLGVVVDGDDPDDELGLPVAGDKRAPWRTCAASRASETVDQPSPSSSWAFKSAMWSRSCSSASSLVRVSLLVRVEPRSLLAATGVAAGGLEAEPGGRMHVPLLFSGARASALSLDPPRFSLDPPMNWR